MTTKGSPRTTLAAGQFELIAKALADPRRAAILEAIADDECTAQGRLGIDAAGACNSPAARSMSTNGQHNGQHGGARPGKNDPAQHPTPSGAISSNYGPG